MGEFLNSMEWYYLSQEKETIPALSFKDEGKKEFKIAPRPLLVESGVNDTCFKFEFTKKAHQQLKRIYKAAGVLDKLEFDIFMGEHSFTGNRAFPFFNKYLKK